MEKAESLEPEESLEPVFLGPRVGIGLRRALLIRPATPGRGTRLYIGGALWGVWGLMATFRAGSWGGVYVCGVSDLAKGAV